MKLVLVTLVLLSFLCGAVQGDAGLPESCVERSDPCYQSKLNPVISSDSFSASLRIQSASSIVYDFEDTTPGLGGSGVTYLDWNIQNYFYGVLGNGHKYLGNNNRVTPSVWTRNTPFSPIRIWVAKDAFTSPADPNYLDTLLVEGLIGGVVVATQRIPLNPVNEVIVEAFFDSTFHVGIQALRLSGVLGTSVQGWFNVDALEIVNGALLGEDPHMRSFDGVHMTVHEEGDFVLAQSPSSGLAFHGRFCKNYRGPWAPWTCALALRCSAGEAAVELSARSFALPTTEQSSAVASASANGTLVVACAGLTVAVVRQRFHRMSYLNLRVTPTSGASDMTGLLGSPNGQAEDDLTHRDGIVSGPTKTKEHYIGANVDGQLAAIRESWRVRSDERLFKSDFSTASSLVYEITKKGSISESAAEKICANAGVKNKFSLAMCAHDVSMTGTGAFAANCASSFLE